MPERTMTYSQNGLVYEIRVYEENGAVFAEISVVEGHMDVNAVYVADSDFSGTSQTLSGPLNMNGARLDGEAIQWDAAIEVSRPGLGPDGADKTSYLTAGESLVVELTGITSLDDVDLIGIRATSTSTPEGSIKAVTPLDEPEEPEPEIGKVFFQTDVLRDENGDPILNDFGQEQPIGVSLFATTPPGGETTVSVVLPPGTDPTLENYLDYFDTLSDNPDYPDWPTLDQVQQIVVYEVGPDGELIELQRIDPADLSPLPEIPVEDEDEVPPPDETEDEDAAMA